MMQTFTDENGNSFELPKLTIALDKKRLAASKNANYEELVKLRYNFLKDVLPKEYLEKRLDGKTESTIDIIQLGLLFMKVNSAYVGDLQKEQFEDYKAQTEQFTEMLESVTPLIQLSESMNKINNRQGFNRVV